METSGQQTYIIHPGPIQKVNAPDGDLPAPENDVEMRHGGSINTLDKASLDARARTQTISPLPETDGPRENRFTKRANGITVVSGQQGTGKSHHLKEKIARYIKDDTITGKAGGKVLIYDTNDEFGEIPPIGWDQLELQPDKSAYRVIGGQIVNGIPQMFDIETMRKGFMYLLQTFKKGMLVLDDFNSYTTNTKKQDVVGTLVTARHRQIDIVIVVQDIGMVTPELWRNTAYYTFHKQMTSVEASKDKMTHYALMKIAEQCVNEQYYAAQRMFDNGKISEDTLKEYQSWYVHVDFRKNKIYGASRERFIRASKNFRKENMTELKKMCVRMNLNSRLPENIEKAANAMVSSDMIMWGGQ